MSVLLAGRLARGGSLAPGWVEIDGERIAAIGEGEPPRAPDEEHTGVLAPGLLDLQVNGAGGHEVTGGPAALDAIDAIQLAHGVTGYVPTIVSTDDMTVERSLAELAERAADPASPVLGVHLEGPFLARAQAGMHPPERLRSPGGGVPQYVWSDCVRLVTMAPELPGALELVAALADRGVAVALGHSAADAETARAALAAGARLVTHVFDAMAPLHHRAPGLVGVALTDDRAAVGVIADGLHVDPIVLELVRRAAGPKVVLVSDASPAAAAPAGRYRFAGVDIERTRESDVRTSDGRLAGSALTLDAAVRGWASLTRSSLAEAIAAASEAPAAVLGLPAGLRAGAPAHVVVLDDEGAVQRTMRRGRWLDPP